ncbi:MAG: DUF427 domain-containing protein [Actinomycetota bacterium]|nr:DUF427 domain-containing protein [Actinomycetota bacterium]
MTLTIGTGPFGERPAGTPNVERSGAFLLFEDSPRRVRAKFGGETVVDSRRAKLLHEEEHLPVYYVPESDVRMDLLEPTEHSTHCPRKGDASYWTLRVGDKVSANAAWSYSEPLESAPSLTGYLAFFWDKLDAWFEEDEQVFGHARDPYHRIDTVPTSRQVRVRVDGEVLAESTRAWALFETGLPTRWYLPPEDVRRDLLLPSDKQTRCAYKGLASYCSIRAGGELVADAVWFYPQPLRDAQDVKDRLCFYNERVDIELDGEPQERPNTRFS